MSEEIQVGIGSSDGFLTLPKERKDRHLATLLNAIGNTQISGNAGEAAQQEVSERHNALRFKNQGSVGLKCPTHVCAISSALLCQH